MIGKTGTIVELTNVRTPMEAEMLQDILQQEGIAVMVKEPGSGGYSKIYMGISLFGETLYVNDYDYPRAVELMQAMQQNSEADMEAAIEAAIEESLKDTQTKTFADADEFDAYEVAQLEEAEALEREQSEQTGQKKNIGAAILAALLIIALLMYNL